MNHSHVQIYGTYIFLQGWSSEQPAMKINLINYIWFSFVKKTCVSQLLVTSKPHTHTLKLRLSPRNKTPKKINIPLKVCSTRFVMHLTSALFYYYHYLWSITSFTITCKYTTPATPVYTYTVCILSTQWFYLFSHVYILCLKCFNIYVDMSLSSTCIIKMFNALTGNYFKPLTGKNVAKQKVNF